jgi:hypothetical protein
VEGGLHGGSSLAEKLFSGLFGSLLEVLAGLDDDPRISVLNLNVVHLPKSLPGAPIKDFSKLFLHCSFSVAKKIRFILRSTGSSKRPRTRRDPKQGTAKDAKSAKSLPDEAFRRSTWSAIWI